MKFVTELHSTSTKSFVVSYSSVAVQLEIGPVQLPTVDSDVEELSSDCPESPESLSTLSLEPNVIESDDVASDEKRDFDENCRLVAIGMEQADQVCIKLNEHIRRGIISKDKIFYGYLKDIVEFFINPRHEYDPEVVEFFNSISYLGGRRTANFLCGPMYVFQGEGSAHNPVECKMNLGGHLSKHA